MTINIAFVKKHEDALLPTYGTKEAAGADVYSIDDYSIEPFSRKLIKTGLGCAIPVGFELQVRPRSGLALKNGITVLNTPGTIDSDYTGELGVILFNSTYETYKVEKGARIAQIVVAPVIQGIFSWTDQTRATDRSSEGFGTTGV